MEIKLNKTHDPPKDHNRALDQKIRYYKQNRTFLRKIENLEDDIKIREIETITSRPEYVFFPNDRPDYHVRKNRYLLNHKRVLDVVFSSLIIVTVMSWLYPVLYVLITIESKGPVLFKQKRTGLNEDHFECLKFRSMHITSQEDILPSENLEARLTAVGRFIRKYSLDELPQFFNVIKGDMSVIGPRPHMVCETELFKRQISDFHIRHQVKPGITGLAQISGYRGHIGGISELKNRLRYDLYYIERASLEMDVRIIVGTVRNMFLLDKKAR